MTVFIKTGNLETNTYAGRCHVTRGPESAAVCLLAKDLQRPEAGRESYPLDGAGGASGSLPVGQLWSVIWAAKLEVHC